MRYVSDFFLDATKTLLYIALSPLQWLFWHMPRVYEGVISTIVFWKNTIPSQQEILYTLNYWSISLLIVWRGMLLYILRINLQGCSYLHEKIKNKLKK